MRYLVLVRHATAEKNIEDRHGGSGTSLTAGACEELARLGQRFVCLGLQPTTVYTSGAPQALETTAYLARNFGLQAIQDERLRGLHLGVLAGLSNEEARQRWPGPAACIAAWRRGEIEICDLKIPDAEDYNLFYERGVGFLASLSSLTGDTLVVGSRSILILLISILLGRTTRRGGGYREIPMRCCDFFTFQYRDEAYVFVPGLSVGRLEEK